MSTTRTPSRAAKKPSFFRQGFLIFLPVALLAIVGWFSLVQDKAFVRAEAANNAKLSADYEVNNAVSLLRFPGLIGTNGVRFQVYQNGRLDWPTPVDESLVPQVFDAVALSPEQAHFWQLLEAGIQRRGQFSDAIEAGRQWIALNPPAPFAAKANFDLGSLLLEDGQFEEAAGFLKSVAEKYPKARGETGLYLADLAEMKLLELAFKDASHPSDINPAAQRFCASLIKQPTILGPHLWERALQLEEASGRAGYISGWVRQFNRDNQTRDLFTLLEPELLRHLREINQAEGEANTASGVKTNLPPSLWYWTDYLPGGPPNFQTNHWLVICEPAFPGAYSVKLLATGTMEGFFQGRRLDSDGRLHPWHWQFDIAGRTVFQEKAGSAGKTALELLASSKITAGAVELAQVSVFMEPDGIFYFQRQRMRRFGFLIALAILVALLGLVSARNAFHRQAALSEMKSNFVASVSHELRAPIASVRLMAESLERGKITDATKQSDYFRFIVQECRRLTALVENVLDFSRIEQGRQQYDFEATNPVRLLQETCKLMEPAAAERQVRLAREWDGTQLSLVESQWMADGRALQQALVNLIDNAIKHSPPGATVRVGAQLDGVGKAEAALNSSLSFWVEDQGAGIPLDEHRKIFERFYRRGSELRRETQGVGIGLSIVQHIVEAHGGKITVKSEPGQGSRFTIELPLRQEINPRKRG